MAKGLAVGPVAAEVHSFDQHVRGGQQMMAFRKTQHCSIVADAAPDTCTIGRPLADALNQLKLTKVLQFQNMYSRYLDFWVKGYFCSRNIVCQANTFTPSR